MPAVCVECQCNRIFNMERPSVRWPVGEDGCRRNERGEVTGSTGGENHICWLCIWGREREVRRNQERILEKGNISVLPAKTGQT